VYGDDGLFGVSDDDSDGVGNDSGEM